jgi:hypothetical protein
MGSLEKRFQEKNTFHEQFITRYIGLQDNATNIILELSLFPHGHGAYGGKISKHEYLKSHMNTLFSPFALFKPYF